MANIKVDEFEYFQFFGMVKSLINELDQNTLSDSAKQRIQVVSEYIYDKEYAKGLTKERNLYYQSYLNKKEEDPIMAANLYKLYVAKKEEIEKVNKKSNTLNKLLEEMEEEHEQ